MQIDKKTVRHLMYGAFGCIALYWLLLDTQRVSLFLKYIWGLFYPFILGAAIAFIFNVPMRGVERHLGWIRRPGLRRVAAVVLTLVLFVLIVASVIFLLVPQIQKTIESLVATLPDFAKREVANIQAFLEAHPELYQLVLEHTDLESIDWSTVIQRAGSILGNSLSAIADKAFTAIGNVTNGIVTAFVAGAFCIYSLGRKEILARQGRRLLYALVPEKLGDQVVRVLRLANSTFSSFISGQCLEACILGCLFAVTMLFFRMPYIPLVSVIIAITALVPVVGAFVGCVLGAFFILVESPIKAVTFVAMFLILQQLENNLIYPRVVGTSIGLPGMWVLFSVTVGGELMGVGGMFLMIPLTSVVYALLGEFTAKRCAARQIPPEKLSDQPPELTSKFRENREKKKRDRMSMRSFAEKAAAKKQKK